MLKTYTFLCVKRFDLDKICLILGLYWYHFIFEMFDTDTFNENEDFFAYEFVKTFWSYLTRILLISFLVSLLSSE